MKTYKEFIINEDLRTDTSPKEVVEQKPTAGLW